MLSDKKYESFSFLNTQQPAPFTEQVTHTTSTGEQNSEDKSENVARSIREVDNEKNDFNSVIDSTEFVSASDERKHMKHLTILETFASFREVLLFPKMKNLENKVITKPMVFVADLRY